MLSTTIIYPHDELWFLCDVSLRTTQSWLSVTHNCRRKSSVQRRLVLFSDQERNAKAYLRVGVVGTTPTKWRKERKIELVAQISAKYVELSNRKLFIADLRLFDQMCGVSGAVSPEILHERGIPDPDNSAASLLLASSMGIKVWSLLIHRLVGVMFRFKEMSWASCSHLRTNPIFMTKVMK
jgi:hypothetical protein